MNAIVDTNVIAYRLLGVQEFAAETERFWQVVGGASAPAIWEAEIANVIWMAVRRGVLEEIDADRRLRSAAGLGVHSIRTRSLWQGALLRAIRSNVSVYDTLFVELAIRERLPLATFDRKLLETFPETAARPRDLAA